MSVNTLTFTYLPASPYLYGFQPPSWSGIPAAATMQNTTRYCNNYKCVSMMKKYVCILQIFFYKNGHSTCTEFIPKTLHNFFFTINFNSCDSSSEHLFAVSHENQCGNLFTVTLLSVCALLREFKSLWWFRNRLTLLYIFATSTFCGITNTSMRHTDASHTRRAYAFFYILCIPWAE